MGEKCVKSCACLFKCRFISTCDYVVSVKNKEHFEMLRCVSKWVSRCVHACVYCCISVLKITASILGIILIGNILFHVKALKLRNWFVFMFFFVLFFILVISAIKHLLLCVVASRSNYGSLFISKGSRSVNL